MIDYEALRPGAKAGMPEDGSYTARLEKATLNDYDQLVTEWSADELWWESRNRFEGQSLQFTNEFLDGLGVDRSLIADMADDDHFRRMLAEVQGNSYHVRVVVNHGQSRTFYNTYVDGPVVSPQSELGEDPVAVEAAAGGGQDDDVPF
jgi:hypothetical protein